jgi:hypothetical protein
VRPGSTLVVRLHERTVGAMRPRLACSCVGIGLQADCRGLMG